MKRRKFFAAAASAALLPSATSDPAKDPAYLQGLASHVDREQRDHGGVGALPTAMRSVEIAEQAVESRDRHVQAAAASVAASAVWILSDAGRLAAGDKVGRLALELARRSGDLDAQSRALSALVRIEVQRGDAGGAVRHALQAIRLPEIPDVQRNFLTLRLGEALSVATGQQYAARDTLDSLLTTLADTEDQATYQIAHQTVGAAQALYKLGAHQETLTCLDEAMRLGVSPVATGYTFALRASIAFHAKQPDLAANQMRALARVTPLVHSVRLNNHVDEVLGLSTQWTRVPEVRQAHQALQSVRP